MIRTQIPRTETRIFSDISNKLTYAQEELTEFLQTPVSPEAFEKQIALKKQAFSPEMRQVLVRELQSAYEHVEMTDETRKNLRELESENTFTVTTGHQLSLLTGPLFFIYKILHVIRLAEKLNENHSGQHVVPIFWMASEDHDFEEVDHLELFNKTLRWETEQQGAVGRFNTSGLDVVRSEFASFFENHPEGEVMELLKSFDGKNYAEACFRLVNKLFGHYGLLILDADNSALKKQVIPVFEKELSGQFSEKAVLQANERLEARGLKQQLHARPINLFYLAGQSRKRILATDKGFMTGDETNPSHSWTREELERELHERPEAFSPNVVLRPLYQECILPNLCYVGGGGELAYWLQLKGVFEAVNVPFPLLQIRNSLMIVDANSRKKMDKAGLRIESLFETPEMQKKQFVLEHSEDELNFEELDRKTEALQQQIIDQVGEIDKGLSGYAAAEASKIEKQIKSLQQKLIRSEKNKYDQSLQVIDQLHERFFPNGSFQERVQSFFSLCADGQVYDHLRELHDAIDPFEKDLIILETN